MKKLTRRDFMKVTGISSVGIVSALALAGCGAKEPTAPDVSAPENAGVATTTKDTMIIRMNVDPGTLDLAQGSVNEGMQLLSMVGAKLMPLMTDEAGNYVTTIDDRYGLATAVKPDDDGKGLTFYLREGVKWHNGDDFTANDVVVSLKRYSKNGSWTPWCDFENITAVNDHEVHVPYLDVYAMGECLMGAAIICNANVINPDDPTTVSKNYVGLGAYYIDNWVDGDSVTLKRFDDYFGGKPQIETIIVRFIADASVAMMELETGGVDIVDSPNWASAKSVIDGDYEGQLKYSSAMDLYLNHLWFCSHKDNLFADIRLRKAIAFALDRDAIAYGAFEGLGNVANTVVSKTMEAVIDIESWPYTRDLDKARQLMAEAGYPDGFDIVLMNQGETNDILADEIIANQLKEIGINVTIDTYDVATWNSIMNEQPSKWDLTLRTYGGSSIPAKWWDVNIKQLCHVSPDSDSAYLELETLSKEAMRTMDFAARTAITKGIQERYLDEWLYTYPIIQKTQYCLYGEDVQGVVRIGYYWFMLDAYFN